MKGASGYGKAGDTKTTANGVSEDRSEPPDCSRSGLSGCMR